MSSAAIEDRARTLWVHWGRSGGGPRFLADLVEGDLLRGDDAPRASSDPGDGSDPGGTAVSFNADAEIAGRLGELPVPPELRFVLRTYSSTAGVVLGLPRLAVNALRLRRWLRRHRIRRVVCVMEGVYQSLAVPLIVPRGTEYVACIHDGRAHSGEGHPVQRLGRALELRRADRIVCLSEEVAEQVREVTDRPVLAAEHPPFDLADARTEPREAPVDRPWTVGVFGRLHPYKGVELALRTARELERRGLGDRVRLRIVGRGPEERHRGTELGAHADWDARWIPEEEVSGIVDRFDVMLLPYTDASKSGPVALAMTHAVPCVVTPVGALPSQVEGFGVVAGDVTPEALADAVGSVVTDPGLHRSLSRGAVGATGRAMTWSGLARAVRTGRR